MKVMQNSPYPQNSSIGSMDKDSQQQGGQSASREFLGKFQNDRFKLASEETLEVPAVDSFTPTRALETYFRQMMKAGTPSFSNKQPSAS